jgi:DNA/RNA-binding domain of Phe-tRNA-synthetase-like protein
MHLSHSPEIWNSFPELSVGALHASGISIQPSATTTSISSTIAGYYVLANERLKEKQEGEFTEIKAWRKVFGKMGLKPTQYRCASESLLRRFRKEGSLPYLHPLVDLCNAISLASALPIAVFDVDQVESFLEVRYATGTENYLDFSGSTEHPDAREVIFADQSNNAHARRWANRQSALSAIRNETKQVLIVIEAHHADAESDVRKVMLNVSKHLKEFWSITPTQAALNSASPKFDW